MNMSYCKYENTYNDLKQCYNAMINEVNEADDDLSRSELRFKSLLIDLCHNIIDLQSNDFDD